MSELFESLKGEFVDFIEDLKSLKKSFLNRVFSFLFALLLVSLGFKKTLSVLVLTFLFSYSVKNGEMLRKWIDPNYQPKSSD